MRALHVLKIEQPVAGKELFVAKREAGFDGSRDGLQACQDDLPIRREPLAHLFHFPFREM